MAATYAAQLRDEHNLTDLSAVSVHKILKSRNIQAVFKPMSENISGLAIKTITTQGRGLCFMMVNTSKALGHQRFTACHEFFHLLFQPDFTFVSEKTASFNENDENEYTADWFASYLIMPRNGLERIVPLAEQQKNKIKLTTLLEVESNYRCSRKNLLFRLKDLGWIDSAGFDLYASNVKQCAYEYGFSTEIYEATNKEEFVGDYHIKARQLLEMGKISQAKYFSLLEDMGIDLNQRFEDHEEV